MKKRYWLFGLIIGAVVGFGLELVLNSCGQYTVNGGLECFQVVPSIWTTVVLGVLGAILGLVLGKIIGGPKRERKKKR